MGGGCGYSGAPFLLSFLYEMAGSWMVVTKKQETNPTERKEEAMNKIQEKKQEAVSEIEVLFRCENRFCEVSSENVSMAESAVEELAAQALSTIFETVLVGMVSVTFPPAHASADSPIVISLRAQGINPLPSVDLTPLDCAIEDRLACALVELFGLLNVEQCAVC
jgi:hypothetical protein